MGKSTDAPTPAQLTEWRREIIDRVTVISGENQLGLMDEMDRMRAQMGRIIVQVEGLRQDVEAMLKARVVGA